MKDVKNTMISNNNISDIDEFINNTGINKIKLV